jgi:hypothetical protein
VPPDLLTFVQGDATQIPLPSDSFDVVTCQTLLMHLARPTDALREMLRILRPGGLLVCVEPNNLWNYLPFTSLTAQEPVEVLARRFEFWLRYHRGKAAAGQGDHTIGDLLPGAFAQAGLTDIAVHLSDRAPALFPPYETAAQQALVQQGQQWKDSATGPWDRAELRRHVLGGGGTDELFECTFEDLNEAFNRAGLLALKSQQCQSQKVRVTCSAAPGFICPGRWILCCPARPKSSPAGATE